MRARQNPADAPRQRARIAPVLALAGWIVLAVLSHGGTSGNVGVLLGLLAAQWLVTGLGVRWARFLSPREWLFWGLALRLVGIVAVPILDDDYHRFLWDGRMFAVAGNPYSTTPGEHFSDEALPEEFAFVLDRINYPDVPTVYGPVTEFGFLVAYLVADADLWGWKLLLVLADVALMLAVGRLSRDAGSAVAFLAMCPLSIFETAFNAHPDALGVALMAMALASLPKSNCAGVSSGMLCGLAFGAKVFAVVMIPLLVWRGGRRALLACAAVVVAVYSPFWLIGSSADLGGLRAMGADWEFNSSGFALLNQVMDPARARLASLALISLGLGAGLIVGVRRRVGLEGLGEYAFLWTFLWAPAFNPWYALWLLPFVALRRRPGGVAVLGAVSLSYLTRMNLGSTDLDGFSHPAWVRPVEFGIIALAYLPGLITGLASLRRKPAASQ